MLAKKKSLIKEKLLKTSFNYFYLYNEKDCILRLPNTNLCETATNTYNTKNMDFTNNLISSSTRAMTEQNATKKDALKNASTINITTSRHKKYNQNIFRNIILKNNSDKIEKIQRKYSFKNNQSLKIKSIETFKDFINNISKSRNKTEINLMEYKTVNTNQRNLLKTPSCYYLTGDTPGKFDYITYKLDCNNTNNTNDDENKNSDILNEMSKNDKKIEEYAKSLFITKNKTFNYKLENIDCTGKGDNVRLDNGFYNGTNFVFTPKKYEKPNNFNNIDKNISNDNNNENKLTFDSYGYSFIPKKIQLPLYLRENYNIKGTKIISPFCVGARDENLYKRIFYDFSRKDALKSDQFVNNKMNIFYANNEEQFQKTIKKINEKSLNKNGKIIHDIGPEPTDNLLREVKKRVKFMKKIIDYAYPNMVLARVREKEKINKKLRGVRNNYPPFIQKDIIKNKHKKILTDNLCKSITLLNK